MAALVLAIVAWRAAARSAPRASSAVIATTAPAAEGVRQIDLRSLARASLTGKVTAIGVAVAAARVCADPMPGAGLATDVLRDAHCTETDATGAYTIEALLPASYQVTAWAAGHAPVLYNAAGNGRLVLAPGEHAANIDLGLHRGGALLVGTISDVGGGPIAHAQVRAVGGGEADCDAITESDDRGAYALWVRSTELDVTASADGYGDATARGTAPGEIDVVLAPEASIAGTVVDGDSGAPLEGVRVTVSRADGPGESEALSDAAGAWHVERITPGHYTITARGAHAYGTAAAIVPVAIGEHVGDVAIAAHAAQFVEGKVTVLGKPCARPSGSLEDADRARSIWSVAAGEGVLRFEGVLAGSYRVHVYCEGARDHEPAPRSPAIVVTTADVTGLAWAVEPGATVRGVITAGGAPVAGAVVSLANTAGQATTADDGRYSIEGVAPGTFGVNVRSDRALQRDAPSATVGETGVVSLDLELEPAGAIAGTVVDASGQPIAHADVKLAGEDNASTATGADGSFTLAPVSIGEARLIVSYDSSGNVLHRAGATEADDDNTVATVIVSAGQTAHARVVVDSAAQTLAGTVVGPGGAPVPDATVEVAGSFGTALGSVLTDEHGAFRVTGVHSSDLHVTATRDGVGQVSARNVDPATPLKLELVANGSIDGVVHGADGPPRELTILAMGEAPHSQTLYRTGGKFSFADLPPGMYTVTFDSEAGHGASAVFLEAGQHEHLEVTLDPVLTVRGRLVRRDDHQPLAGARITAALGPGGDSLTVETGEGSVTDVTGEFVLRRAVRGNLQLRIYSGSLGSWYRTVVIAGPELGDLELELRDRDRDYLED